MNERLKDNIRDGVRIVAALVAVGGIYTYLTRPESTVAKTDLNPSPKTEQVATPLPSKQIELVNLPKCNSQADCTQSGKSCYSGTKTNPGVCK